MTLTLEFGAKILVFFVESNTSSGEHGSILNRSRAIVFYNTIAGLPNYH